MAKDLYDFGWAWEMEEEVITDEVKTEDETQEQLNEWGVANPTDADGGSEEETNSDDVQPEDKTNNEPVNPGTELETEIDTETEALDKELKELEDILNWWVESWVNQEETNWDVSNQLKDAVTKMKGLVTKIDKLELEKAELTKFGDSAWLSPEVIIIKAHYDKAKKGDQASIGKIKELIASDLWLDVVDQKKVFVSNSISSWTDVNTNSSEDDWGFGFVM